MTEYTYKDIANTNVFIDENKLLVAIQKLQPEHRRMVKLLANTIQEPMEIWNKWIKNKNAPNNWEQYRCYYQHIDTSQTDLDNPNIILEVRFILETTEDKWLFNDFNVYAGEIAYLNKEIAPQLRNGVRVYP